MATNGTSFEIDIDAPADSVEAAAEKVVLLSKRLSESGDSAATASAAMKAADAAYKAAEGTADRAAKAVEKIGLQADAQRGKLAKALEAGDERAFWKIAGTIEKLNERQAEAVAASESAKAAMNDAAAALDAASVSAASAAKEQERYTQALANTKTQASAMAATMDAVRASNDALAKAFIRQSAASIKAAQDEQAARIATMEAVKNSNQELLDSFLRRSNAEVKAAKVAADARKKADDVKNGSGKVNEMAEAFGALGGPLGAVGQRAFGAAEGMKKMLGSMGSAGIYAAIAIAVAAIAAGVAAVTAATAVAIAKTTLWAVRLADKEGEIDKQTKRLSDSINKLFGGLKIDKLLGGLSKIVDLFDETSITGRAIKVVFESLFQPIVDGLTDLAPMIVKAFIQFEIWALRALIAIKPFGSTILTVVKVLGVMAAVVTGVLVVAIGLVVANLAILAVAVAAVATAAVALVAGVVWLVTKLTELGVTVGTYLRGAFDEALAWLSALDLSQIGSDLIAGLVAGITGGATAVVSAITGVVDGAIGAAKSLLGIASPSKVFADIGANTAEGMAGGVEDGTSQVQGSLESMVAPPTTDASAVGGGSGTGGGGSSYYLTFQISGGDASANAKAARDEFVDFLESIGAVAGVAVPS